MAWTCSIRILKFGLALYFLTAEALGSICEHCSHLVRLVEESLFFFIIREILIAGVDSSGSHQGVIKNAFFLSWTNFSAFSLNKLKVSTWGVFPSSYQFCSACVHTHENQFVWFWGMQRFWGKHLTNERLATPKLSACLAVCSCIKECLHLF